MFIAYCRPLSLPYLYRTATATVSTVAHALLNCHTYASGYLHTTSWHMWITTPWSKLGTWERRLQVGIRYLCMSWNGGAGRERIFTTFRSWINLFLWNEMEGAGWILRSAHPASISTFRRAWPWVLSAPSWGLGACKDAYILAYT